MSAVLWHSDWMLKRGCVRNDLQMLNKKHFRQIGANQLTAWSLGWCNFNGKGDMPRRVIHKNYEKIPTQIGPQGPSPVSNGSSRAMTLPRTLSSQALYLLRVWHKHLPSGHLNGLGLSVAPYKRRTTRQGTESHNKMPPPACPRHRALAIFEIRIAEFMLCVPQSEAVSMVVPMSKLKLQTQTWTQRKTKTAPICATLALKVSSDFRWGSLELTAHGAWRWVDWRARSSGGHLWGFV